MLKKFPSLSGLPVSLPESIRDRLAQTIEPQAVSECSWITLSLIHASYINEHQQEFEKAKISIETLDLMKDLGAKLARLALFHLAYENPKMQTPGEADHFVQAAMRNVPTRIAWDLGLMNAAFVGSGTSRDLDNNRLYQRFLSLFGHQLLGAIGICTSYRTLFSLIETHVKTSYKAPVPIASYKTVLQEYTQGRRLRQPEYKIVRETGPAHNRLFHVQVCTRDGKWAEGEGSSKKRAEGDAARQYMERFASDYLAKKPWKATTVGAQVRSPHVTPELHRRGVQDLCKLLKIPQDKMCLLSQALVHSSFLNETPLENVQDNTLLAQLGSQVLAAIASELVFSAFLEQTSSSDKEFPYGAIMATFCDTSNVSKGFDLLKLEKLFLVGRGQSQTGLSDTVKADAFQAVLASLFLAYGALEDAETFLPDKLLNWLTDSIDTLVAKSDEIIDPKNKLQRQLQAIGMTWEYRATYQGPDHAQEWEASITLSSRPTERRFVLRGGVGVSRRQAEKHIASLVSSTIDDVNSGIGVLPTNTLLRSKGVHSFATFLLRHEFASAPTSSAAARKWQKEGMLGSQLLAQKRKKRVKEFRFWANAVEALFREDEGEIPPPERALAFYKELSRPASYNRSRHLYREGIAAIRRLLEELDPDKQQPDVRQRHEFSEIISLSKISRLLSRERRKANLSDILDGFLLLRRGRFPTVQLTGHFSDLSLSEREGIYQTMLNEVLALLDGDDYDTINLSVIQRPEEMAVDFDFGLPHNLKSTEGIQRFVSDSSLWKFLKEEIPIIDINISPEEIHLHCGAYSSRTPNPFAERALEAYHQQEGFSGFENEAIGRFLHDLKNQLIAYQVSLESSGPDRTSQLKSQYEASRHLDIALSIFRSLETIGQAMSTPMIEPFDIGELFRQYVAQKMTTVPSNIRIAPPRMVESCEVWTAPEFLHSIIENLVKNSVEAMPDGGEIRLDWIFDQTEKSLLIEVVDNGPGISDALLEHLLAGKPIESTKERGSGIGILTVKTMLKRIGGAISAESVLDRGTRWTIVLPSLEETDESIDLVKTDDVETLVASEKEADLQ